MFELGKTIFEVRITPPSHKKGYLKMSRDEIRELNAIHKAQYLEFRKWYMNNRFNTGYYLEAEAHKALEVAKKAFPELKLHISEQTPINFGF